MARFDRSMFAISAGIATCLATPAQATWSILIADTRTGEIVIGSATCVELIDLQLSTPVLISGVGAVTAQSAVDNTGFNRQLIRDRLLQGVPLDAILDELSVADNGHNNRQYGMINTFGETLTYSGIDNAAWAGGLRGRLERGVPGPQDDIVYTVQGNILSGGNVVQAAVDAIEMSNGDLPAMMMEAMIAAKDAGGDGRCSCSNANPTGCGSPPPSPFKSAHVGYMLGTRAGDRDATRAIYPINGTVGAMETIDLDGDGYEEVIIGNRDTNEISIYRNTSSEGVPLSSLELWQTIEAPASGAVASTFDQYNSTLRFSIAYNNPSRVVQYQLDETGSLEVNDVVGFNGTPMDFTRDNRHPNYHAISFQSPNRIRYFSLLQDKEFQSIDLDYAPAGIAIENVVGFNAGDLLVTDPVNNLIHIYEDKEGGFGVHTEIQTANDPVKVAAADMDQDGDNEILVLTGTGRSVQIFNYENDAWTEWASINIAGIGIGFDVGDMNGDGFPDVISTVQATNRNMRLNISDGQGGFSLQSRTRVGSNARSVLIRDMNNNGELDVVVGHQGAEGLVVLDNPGDGEFPQPQRFADGDYFMSFNIPNQRAADVDPVDQLKDLYDAWLLEREGRVDAVLSSVQGRTVLAPGSSSILTIELRDLHGNLLNISDPAMVQLEPENGDVFVSDPELLEPGVFRVSINSTTETGATSIGVLAGMPEDRVQLMPEIEVVVGQSLADFDGNGVCNYFDVTAFIGAFLSQDPNADIVPTATWDFLDIAEFLLQYNSCNSG